MESQQRRKSSVEQLSLNKHIIFTTKRNENKDGELLAERMVYRAANGWILLVPRGGRWQEVVVVVVVVAGRRHLVVVVVAASLLQSPASSAGGRHLVCLSTRCYSRRLLQQMQSWREEKLQTAWNWVDTEFWNLRGDGHGLWRGSGGKREGLLSTILTNVSKTLFNQEFDYSLVREKNPTIVI